MSTALETEIFVTYLNALKKIGSFGRFSGAPSLERMRLLLRYLGDPQKKLKFIHIAGTNGKGSAAAMLDSVLREAGYRTGRFVSPYILDFKERITVDGEMISCDALARNTAAVISAVTEMQRDIERAKIGEKVPFDIAMDILSGRVSESPVQFEIVTAIGFMYFLECGCDAVVLECGLGGTFDATNVIDPPMAALIMSIGLDHTELLGDTVEKIAAEKCGIIKKGTEEVISYPQVPEAAAVISNACVSKGARLSVAIRSEIRLTRASLGGLEFEYKGRSYKTRLAAAYQLMNAASVIEAAEALMRVGMNISYEDVANGIERATFPARFEVLGASPAFIVDGAHNAPGIKALCDSLSVICNSFDGKVSFLLGMLEDKEPEKALEPFLTFLESGNVRAGKIITLTPDSPRAMEAARLAEIISSATGGKYETLPLESKGRQLKKDLLKILSDMSSSDALISFGSLYLAAGMRTVLKEILEENTFS